jgi:hypothetical protein
MCAQCGRVGCAVALSGVLCVLDTCGCVPVAGAGLVHSWPGRCWCAAGVLPLSPTLYSYWLCWFVLHLQQQVAILDGDEQRFLEATMAYSKGAPIMSDEDYDTLKNELRMRGSFVSALVCGWVCGCGGGGVRGMCAGVFRGWCGVFVLGEGSGVGVVCQGWVGGWWACHTPRAPPS